MNHGKLPILYIVLFSYRFLFHNTKIFLKLVWFPIGVGVFFPFLINALQFSQKEISLSFLAFGYLFPILLIPAITSWHRLIILKSGENSPRVSYAIKKNELVYAWKLFIFYLAYGVVSAIIILPLSALMGFMHEVDFLTQLQQNNQFPINIVVSSVALWPISGMLLMLPAAAIGMSIGMGEADVSSRGNKTRIWLSYILALAPTLILQNLFEVSFDTVMGENSDNIMVVRALFYTTVEILFMMITVGVVSLSYIWVAEERELPTIK
jgi:hypothetical protein